MLLTIFNYCPEPRISNIIRNGIKTLLWPRFLWNGLITIIDYFEKKNRDDGKVNCYQERSRAYHYKQR